MVDIHLPQVSLLTKITHARARLSDPASSPHPQSRSLASFTHGARILWRSKRVVERASGRLWQLSTYDWTGRANLGIPTQSYHDINRHTPGSPRGFSALVSRLAFVLFCCAARALAFTCFLLSQSERGAGHMTMTASRSAANDSCMTCSQKRSACERDPKYGEMET